MGLRTLVAKVSSFVSIGSMRLKNMKNKFSVLQWALRVIRDAFLLPQTIAAAFKGERRETARDAVEAERLDRIRNPSDYLGKS